LLSVIGCIFLAFGSYWAIIVGATLINIGFLFDVVDGNIARYNNSCTKYGEYIDRMTAAIISPFMFVSIGIGILNHPNSYLNPLSQYLLELDVSGNIYLILGLVIAFLYSYSLLITANLWAVFSVRPVDYYKPEAKQNGWRIIYKLGLGVESLTWPVLLVAAVLDLLSLFLLLWTIVVAGYFIMITTRALYGGRRLK